MAVDEFDTSDLGTKELYFFQLIFCSWDKQYERELANLNANGDAGEIWYRLLILSTF
jgi:hypothetical protein